MGSIPNGRTPKIQRFPVVAYLNPFAFPTQPFSNSRIYLEGMSNTFYVWRDAYIEVSNQRARMGLSSYAYGSFNLVHTDARVFLPIPKYDPYTV